MNCPRLPVLLLLLSGCSDSTPKAAPPVAKGLPMQLKLVVVEDEYGRDLALQYPNTSVIVFPTTMISKRVEDGRDVDVVPIYRTVVAQVEKLKDETEYKR